MTQRQTRSGAALQILYDTFRCNTKAHVQVQHKHLQTDTTPGEAQVLTNRHVQVQHYSSFRVRQTSTGAAKALVHRNVQVKSKKLWARHRSGTTGFCGKDTSRGSTACSRTNNRLFHSSTDFRTGAAKAVVELTSPCVGIAQAPNCC